MRGAWIEITYAQSLDVWHLSLPMRGAWIEIVNELETRSEAKSLPMRGAWIEILFDACSASTHGVAPHAGSVD